MDLFLRTLLTAFQIVWAFLWARKHLLIRKNRHYAIEREKVNAVGFYKQISIAMYVIQNVLAIVTFWSDHPALLKIYDNLFVQVSGAILITFATFVYFQALKHLGDNYSPCFDSHRPLTIITSGPYRRIRHPMYTAKVMIGAGTLLLTASLWLVPFFVYLAFQSIRAGLIEDDFLSSNYPDYVRYKKSSKRFLPFLY